MLLLQHHANPQEPHFDNFPVKETAPTEAPDIACMAATAMDVAVDDAVVATAQD